MKRLLFLLCLAVAVIAAYPQQPTLRNFSSTAYRGGSQNWAIEQSIDGRMYFGNNGGLLEYDGQTWHKYYVPNYTVVRSLYCDARQSRLYAGASDEFGYFESNERTHRLEYHSLSKHLNEAARKFDEIWAIHPLEGGFVFQSKQNLFLLDSTRHLITIRNQHRIDCSAVVDGRLLVSSKDGIYYLRHRTLLPLAGTEILKGKTVRAILKMSKRVLFVTSSDGLYLYDGEQTTPYILDITPMLLENQVFCAAINSRFLAFGTVRGGIVLKELATGRNIYCNTYSGLQNNTVLTMRFDQWENIWLGLDNGISYVLNEATYSDLLGAQNSTGSGYTAAVRDGLLYLGTNQGLFFVPSGNGSSPSQVGGRSQTAFSIPNGMRPPTAFLVPGMTGQVWSLREIGGLLLCGTDNGAYVISGTKATRIEGLEGTWNFAELGRESGVRSEEEVGKLGNSSFSRSGKLTSPKQPNDQTTKRLILACDYKGFVVLQVGPSGTVSVRNRLQGFDVVSGGFGCDSDGSVWVSHWQSGIYRLTLNAQYTKVQAVEHFHRGHGLYTDENNALCKIRGRYFISSADGLYEYDRKHRKLVLNQPMTRIFNTYDTPLYIVETPTKDLWAYKPGYMAFARHTDGDRYEVDSLSYKSITQQLQMTLGNVCFLDRQHTIFPTKSGFYIVNSGIKGDLRTCPLHILSVTSINEQTDTVVYRFKPSPIAAGSDTTAMHIHASSAPQEIRLPHRLNSLRFEFAMPEYRDEQAVKYECWLENYDKGWSGGTSTCTKDYTQLQRGRYVFHVRATNRVSGQTEETEIVVRILPAWYETWLAYLIYILCVVALVSYFVRWMNQRAERKLQRLEQEKERQLRDQQVQFEIENERKEKQMALMQKEQIEQEKELVQLRNDQLEKENEVVQLQKSQLEIELMHKSSELADSTMNLIRKNDMLQELDQSMTALSESVRREDLKSRVIKQINDIRHDIKVNMEEDENWDKFEQNFNLVYDNFMQKLSSRFPDLKMNERKLCAYLRMGLSSKEMASLLNTSVRSIETARYRLRKKLNMTQGDNLTDFIQALDREVNAAAAATAAVVPADASPS